MAGLKADTSGAFETVSIKNHEISLALLPHQVAVRKNGIEFLSHRRFPLWREVVIQIRSPSVPSPIEVRGVIVDCTGDRHHGFVASVVFLNIAPEQQAALQRLVEATTVHFGM